MNRAVIRPESSARRNSNRNLHWLLLICRERCDGIRLDREESRDLWNGFNDDVFQGATAAEAQVA